jgi:hypothetical protein
MQRRHCAAESGANGASEVSRRASTMRERGKRGMRGKERKGRERRERRRRVFLGFRASSPRPHPRRAEACTIVGVPTAESPPLQDESSHQTAVSSQQSGVGSRHSAAPRRSSGASSQAMTRCRYSTGKLARGNGCTQYARGSPKMRPVASARTRLPVREGSAASTPPILCSCAPQPAPSAASAARDDASIPGHARKCAESPS